MIKSIKLASLRTSEFSQFIADILSIVRVNDPALLSVQNQFDALQAISIKIEELFKTPAGNIITTELEELDLRRDNAFSGITSLISGYAFSTNATQKSNAALLASHLAVFGSGIAQDNYQSQTATLRNILSDWEAKPTLASAVTELALTPWAAELAEANNSFSQKYLVRASEMGTASPESIKIIRIEANDVYYQLRDHLDARFTINNGDEPFGTTVGSINGLIDNYNRLLSRRGGNDEAVLPGAPPALVA